MSSRGHNKERRQDALTRGRPSRNGPLSSGRRPGSDSFQYLEKRMKAVIRLAGIVGAIGAAFATSLTASASTADHLIMAGSGADAVFSTCPTLPVPGQVCTDTRIAVADQITRADGSTSPGTTLSVDVFKYGMDSSGAFFFVSDTAGFGF